MADEPSEGERLAAYGGDQDMLTAYHNGEIDSHGDPAERFEDHDYAEANDPAGEDGDQGYYEDDR
jgi:hypothetical protein